MYMYFDFNFVHTCTCIYPLQNDNSPLHLAVSGGHATCVERLLSTPGIDVNIKNAMSLSHE